MDVLFLRSWVYAHQRSNQISSATISENWQQTLPKNWCFPLHLIYSFHIRSPFSLSIPWSASDNTFLCCKSWTVIPSWLLSNFTKGFNLLYWQLLFNYSSLNWIVIKWISSSATEQKTPKKPNKSTNNPEYGITTEDKRMLGKLIIWSNSNKSNSNNIQKWWQH